VRFSLDVPTFGKDFKQSFPSLPAGFLHRQLPSLAMSSIWGAPGWPRSTDQPIMSCYGLCRLDCPISADRPSAHEVERSRITPGLAASDESLEATIRGL
jgi:hypothetical protein